MVEALDLAKTFYDRKRGEVRAVDGVSFRAGRGQIFGLLGPNGAGKTTTLRLLSTVFKPSSGTATINGFDIQIQPQRVREQVGFLSAETGLYARLTAREMIAYFGRLYGLTPAAIAGRIEQISSILDMGDFLDARNDKLSTGQRQKVSIARTIVHDPPVMIFDEPAAGLDVLASRAIVTFIKRCRDEGKCVIFSTHRMDEAEKLCERIAIIHNGQIRACGTLQDLFNQSQKTGLEEAFLWFVDG